MAGKEMNARVNRVRKRSKDQNEWNDTGQGQHFFQKEESGEQATRNQNTSRGEEEAERIRKAMKEGREKLS